MALRRPLTPRFQNNKTPIMGFNTARPTARPGQNIFRRPRSNVGGGPMGPFTTQEEAMAASAALTPDGQSPGTGATGGEGGGPGTSPNGLGFFPAYIGGMFPSPSLVTYDPIKRAPYTFVDPMAFAQEFGQFNRDEINKNFNQAQSLALQTLQTELQGLQGFAPAAAALQREQVGIDNIFNQSQRDQQINQALPGVRDELAGQRDRAQAYAEGRAPDSVIDNALNLTNFSRGADAGTYAGFGARSSATRKLSDLMSAESRIGLSQYGDSLLSNNIAARANLFMAPTEYANAGSQIRVNPEVGAGRLTQSYGSELNARTMLDPATALSSEINQNQFQTSLIQRNREFNASNKFAAAQFNANAQNQFAMSKFQYEAGYAASVAGAYQTGLNTEIGLQQQQLYGQQFGAAAQNAQQAGSIQSILGVLGTAAGAYFGGPAGAAVGGSVGTEVGGSVAKSADIIQGSGGSSSGGDLAPAQTQGSSFTPWQETALSTAGVPNSSSAPIVQTPPTVTTAPSIPSSGAGSSTGYNPPVQSYADPSVTSFVTDTGIKVSDQIPVTRALVESANSVLSQAGVFPEQVPGAVPAGFNNQGTPVFSIQLPPSENGLSAGTNIVNGMGSILDALGVGGNEVTDWLDTLEYTSTGADLGSMGEMPEEFVQKFVESYGGMPGEDGASTRAAFTAYQVFNNLGNMSDDQKTAALASAGIQYGKLPNGEYIFDKRIPSTEGEGYDPVTVGNALGFMRNGINAPGLTSKWDQYSNISLATQNSKNANSVANNAASLNLLGNGRNGSAVIVDKGTLQSQGWSEAPHYSYGAISGSSNRPPNGYVVAGRDGAGNIIAIPKGSERTYSGFDFSSNPGRAAGIARIYQAWGVDTPPRDTWGGSQLNNQLANMTQENPTLFSSIMASSMMNNMIEMQNG